MMIEYSILVGMWLFGTVGLILFIPRNRLRKGFLAFLVFQAVIWLCDMPSFKFGLLKAPIRELPKATHLPLTIDYFFYPVLFAIYYLHKNSKSNQKSRVAYFLVWVSAITLFDITLERYTDLLEYEILPYWGMWIYVVFLFYISQVFCDWFYKDKALFQTERWGTQ